LASYRSHGELFDVGPLGDYVAASRCAVPPSPRHYAKAGTLQFSIGRVGGMMITSFVMIACALLILRQVWLGG
jgi:hypothetical protein